MEYNFAGLDDPDESICGSPPSLPSLPLGLDLAGDDIFGTQNTVRGMLRQLRSRPQMDFWGYGHFEATPSQMLGSTLCANSSAFPRKAASSIGFAPRLSPEDIASLTIQELYHNTHFAKLRRQCDYMSKVITTYFAREIAESQVAKNKPPLISDLRQSLTPPNPDSRTASSLGPSDSASQLTRFNSPDLASEKTIDLLLERVEAPSVWPSCLPQSVLWNYEDCLTDKSAGDIVTELNKHRPKMQLAIHCGDGSIISSLDSKLPTKSNIRKWFRQEYSQAILELEAKQKLLHLCSGHWKADTMIGQAFLRHSDAENKWAALRAHAASSSSNFSEPLQAMPASIPNMDMAPPFNAAKHSLEMSPGPKSPSATHAQKRSKDETLISGKKNTGPSVLPNQNHRHAAHKLTLTFLHRPATIQEGTVPTPMNVPVISPSSAVPSANLTSRFPYIVNAPYLLRSMDAQASFKPGEPSENVAMLLECIQRADPSSLDIDEDNQGQSWGHYQFTAGGLSPSSTLTTWQDIGSVATALKLVAAALRTCQDARLMCANARTPKTSGFISDIYLEQILDCLKKCWLGAGGTISKPRVPILPTTPPSLDDTMPPPSLDNTMSHLITIKIKCLTPNEDNVFATTPKPPSGVESTIQQSAASTAPTQEPIQELSAASHKGACADATSLKLLQVPELLAWVSENKVVIPKLKRKDDIIAAIVQTPEFAQLSKSAVKQIVEQRKLKKQITALP
ncbi:hypothetical protein EI94DRAFT_1801601 [Lactarius quietus]|nr:hypothetical protein EI94DRAFT_1801601 [Lactarius quietus]